MRVRADVRRRVGSLVAVALLLGGLGTVAIGGVAAARRTESAYPRYREATNQPEAQFASCIGGQPFPYVDTKNVAGLPGVASVSRAVYAVANARDLQGGMLLYPKSEPFNVNVIAPIGPIDWSPKVLRGRMPNPSAADEVVISWSTVDAPRPPLGSIFQLQFADSSSLDGGSPAIAETDRVRVVGEIITPFSLAGDDVSVITSPAFLTGRPVSSWGPCRIGIVQLTGGAVAAPAFIADLQAADPAILAGSVATEETFFARSTHLDSVIYTLFGILVGFLALTLVGQAIVRRTQLASLEDPVLEAVGMTRSQRFWSSFIPGAVAGLAGTVLAVIGAVLVSAAFPRGIAGFIEPTPGISVDVSVVALGGLVMVLGVLGASGVPAWRGARSRRGSSLGTVEFAGRRGGSRIASALSRAGAPPPAIAGARLALEPGHGRTSVPVRSAIVALAIAVAAVAGGLVFAASMDHFQTDPALTGGSAQLAVGHPFIGAHFQNDVLPVFEAEAGVPRMTVGNFQNLATATGPDGGTTTVAIWGLTALRGEIVTPTMLDGHWPTAADEIVLGKQSARAAGVGIGDTVSVAAGSVSATYRVSGYAVFPEFGFGPGLGDGAGMSMPGLKRLLPDVTNNLVLGDYAPGASEAAIAAVAARLNAALKGKPGGPYTVRPGTTSVSNLGAGAKSVTRSRSLPLLLALVFAVAALATLIHVLITSIRRRRRDVAVLKTLGFSRRQVLATIEWQAALLALVAAVIGVPAGVLIGRWGWALFADRLGVGVVIVVPWLQVLLIVPVAVAVALLIAVGPALAARRTKAAVVLRTE